MNILTIINQIIQEFYRIFSEELITKIARDSGFIKRESKKITAHEFLLALTLGRFKKSSVFYPFTNQHSQN